jgi:hypothetical protein
MDILRRSTVMVSSEAWHEMDEQAKRVLESHLSARKFIDVIGPKGWDYAAHPCGRLDIPHETSEGNVAYGIHQVLPLVESRVTFDLDLWELDNITRGLKNPDLSPLDEAARRIAAFEKYVKESDYFGMVSGREHDKLSITNLTPMRGEKVDAPYIEEFPVSIECKLLQMIELGTHVMLVGKVVNTLADEECLTCDNYPDPEKVRPIIFTPKYRRYYALGADLGEAFHMGRFFMK